MMLLTRKRRNILSAIGDTREQSMKCFSRALTVPVDGHRIIWAFGGSGGVFFTV